MGKSSSAKKVARAARAGGTTKNGPKRNLLFPISIAVVVLVGVLVVGLARGTSNTASAESPAVGEHFHAAYGIYVCDKFLEPLKDTGADTLGIHTHGDGVIHIHPFGSAAAGANATLTTWGKTDGLTFSKNGFTVDGTTYDNGYDCNGSPATVKLYVWNADDKTSAPQIVDTKDIGSFKLNRDRMAIVLAVVPDGTDVPRPTSIPQLDQLSDVAGASTTTTAAAATASTTTTAP